MTADAPSPRPLTAWLATLLLEYLAAAARSRETPSCLLPVEGIGVDGLAGRPAPIDSARFAPNRSRMSLSLGDS